MSKISRRHFVQTVSAASEALGSAGFELGIRVKDPIDDYRSRLLFGVGQFVGINGQGELFLIP